MIDLITFILLTWLPGIELRGSIPFAISVGWKPYAALTFGLFLSSFIYLIGRKFLDVFGELLLTRIRIFRRYVERVRVKKFRTYEYAGLFLFVALPIPGSGVYTGTILSWVFNLDYKKSFFMVFLGNVVAGVIITGTTLGILSLF